MDAAKLMKWSAAMSSPPPGSVNIQFGQTIEGPGGKWVPCATAVAGGMYLSGLFEVGAGRRQVCAIDFAMPNAQEALSRAIELALSAAA